MSERHPATFIFADIAGFTALTEVHGDEDAAELAGRFSDCVSVLLPPLGAEQVKTIGDALMLRVPDAEDAVRLGLAIVYDVMRDHEAPAVRVGMHTGTAVERAGDWFGSTVNTAARVSGLARGNEVLVTDATREAAGGTAAGIGFRPHGRHHLRNVSETVLVLAAVRQGADLGHHYPIDPVCRMAIDPDRAAGVLVHDGHEYHFCSLGCVGAFARGPEDYLPLGGPPPA